MRLIGCLLLCSLVVLATQAPSCISLNPFLPEIEKKMRGTVLQSSPKFAESPKKCGYEWSKHKTCCSYDMLMRYVIQDRSDTEKYAKEIGDNLRSLKEEYNRFKSIMESASKIEGIMKNTNLKGLVSLIKFFNSPESADITFWLSNFGGAELTEAKAKPCIEEIKSIRSGSVCSICSGRSSIWFDGPKAKFSQTYCKPFLNRCKDSISFLRNYGERVKILFQKLLSVDLGALQVNSKDKTISEQGEKMIKVITKLSQMQALNLLNDYLINPDNNKASASLCDSIVTLVHDPFITVTLKMCIHTVDYLRTWNKLAMYLGEKHITTSNNWNLKPRVLQGANLSPFGLEGDVKVLNVEAKVDSSYSSVFGAPGTSKNENSIHIRTIPLNLTEAFP